MTCGISGSARTAAPRKRATTPHLHPNSSPSEMFGHWLRGLTSRGIWFNKVLAEALLIPSEQGITIAWNLCVAVAGSSKEEISANM